MLTKDLVLYTISGDHVIPKFIDPQKESLLAFAGQMLEIFKSAEGKTRAELLALANTADLTKVLSDSVAITDTLATAASQDRMFCTSLFSAGESHDESQS